MTLMKRKGVSGLSGKILEQPPRFDADRRAVRREMIGVLFCLFVVSLAHHTRNHRACRAA